ncbi:NnrS family protein [Aquisalimonas sp. 2447]|uniref:NnrS family protein n=1 Tax=Aquisalimonas sp. 2447 TaxID=2740807 RepID=UPI00143249CD|nr:NnrS family protein [Aquisalimonas sp. 2447]QIT55323.1 NnrS family protein [Aquisalimonas sp. 2447]
MAPPLLSIGFRPFFLVASWFAVLVMVVWVSFLTTGAPAPGPWDPILWHGHELLFGFTAAVIAGFLLTAAQNWTKRQTCTPRSLMVLVTLWLAARLGFLVPGAMPMWLLTVLDLAFFPLLAIMLATALIPAENRRNYAFIPLLLAFTVLNGMIHADFHGVAPGLGSTSMDLAIWLITVLLVFMGGRIIPFFTANRLPGLGVRQWPWLNWASTLSTLAILPVYLVIGRDPWLAVVLTAASLFTLVRLLAWKPWGTVRDPLLWILHASYLFIPFGLGLQAAYVGGIAGTWSAGVHLLMIGAMGGLCLGMMARVALGHSGRPLAAPPLMVGGFAAILLAAAARLLVALGVGPAWLMGASGVLWMVAFALYAVLYTPILLKPRADTAAAARKPGMTVRN